MGVPGLYGRRIPHRQGRPGDRLVRPAWRRGKALTRVKLSDKAVFFLSISLYALVAAAFVGGIALAGGRLINLDMIRFYEMAGVIVDGGRPYVDYQDPKPPLIFFTLTLPLLLGQELLGGLILVGAANLISAVVVMLIGRKLYGIKAGVLAGFLFIINLIWVEGFYILTEPFTLTFLLLSAYLLLFHKSDRAMLLAGALAGVAIGFKQYALLAIPLSLLLFYFRKDLRPAAIFIIGIVLSLAVIFGALLLVYGPDTAQAALHWTFGVAGTYVASDDVEGVPAWKPTDPFEGVTNIVFVYCAFLPLSVLAIAGYLRKPRSRIDTFILLSWLAYAATVLIRPYFHYLILALPFMALLSARLVIDGDKEHAFSKAPWRIASPALSFLLIVGMAMASLCILEGWWKGMDMERIYMLANDVIAGASSLLEPGVLKPAFFAVIPDITLSLLIVAICLCASAVITYVIASRLYGKAAGTLSCLLFATTSAWAIGYLTISEAIMLPLFLLAIYALSFYRVSLPRRAVILLALAATGVILSAIVPVIGVSAFAGYRPDDELIRLAGLVMPMVALSTLLPQAIAGCTSVPAMKTQERWLLACVILLCSTLLIMRYLNGWAFALPLMAVLCARPLATGKSGT